MVMAASAGAPREKSIYYSTVGVVEVPSVLDRWPMMRMIPDINLAAGDMNSPGTDGRPNIGNLTSIPRP